MGSKQSWRALVSYWWQLWRCHSIYLMQASHPTFRARRLWRPPSADYFTKTFPVSSCFSGYLTALATVPAVSRRWFGPDYLKG